MTQEIFGCKHINTTLAISCWGQIMGGDKLRSDCHHHNDKDLIIHIRLRPRARPCRSLDLEFLHSFLESARLIRAQQGELDETRVPVCGKVLDWVTLERRRPARPSRLDSSHSRGLSQKQALHLKVRLYLGRSAERPAEDLGQIPQPTNSTSHRLVVCQ